MLIGQLLRPLFRERIMGRPFLLLLVLLSFVVIHIFDEGLHRGELRWAFVNSAFASVTNGPKNLGPPGCNGCGNPINHSTGNKFQEETDYIGTGPFPIVFKRYYNSQDSDGSLAACTWTGTVSFGERWKFSYSRRVAGHYQQVFGGGWYGNQPYTGERVTVKRDTGQQLIFTYDGANWKPEPDVVGKLALIPTGWTYVNDSDETETYNMAGQLLSVANRSGLKQTLAYNGNGFLSSVTDPAGRVLTLGYGSSCTLMLITSLTAPDGTVQSYSYDQWLHLSAVTRPGGAVRQYVYPPATGSPPIITAPEPLLTGIIDENGSRFATFAYDSSRKAISTEHAGGVEKFSVDYTNFATHVVQVTEPLGAIKTYTTHSIYGYRHLYQMGRACPTCGTLGTDLILGYDANGNLTQVTDFKALNTIYSYDLTRNLETSRTLASGTPQARTISTVWHPAYRLPSQVVDGSRTFTFAYDAGGNLTSAKVATSTENSLWSFTYNSFGEPLTASDPAGKVTTYAYDAKGNLTTVTNPLGKVTNITSYDANGRPLSITDPNGVVTAFTYNFRGQITSRKVGALLTAYTYDAVGQLTKITRPDNSSFTFTYDAAHRLTGVADALGNRIVYTLDAAGNPTKTDYYDPANVIRATKGSAFDGLSRLTQEVIAPGQAYSYAYDPNSNVTSSTDPRGKTTSATYDPLDRLASILDASSAQTTLGYDANGRLASVTDARGLVTNYANNSLDKVVSESSPDRGVIKYERDARGLVTQRTDARGVVTTYTYDAAGRPTYVSYSGQTTYWKSFNWDASAPDNKGVGHLVGAYSEAGLNWRVFDANARITADYRTNNPAPALATNYTYDAAGNITRMTYPSGRLVTYARDAMGRVSSVTTQQNSAAAAQTVAWNLQWNPFGPLAAMSFGYGGVATFIRDTDYRITRLQVGASGNLGGTIDRSMSWDGDIVTSIVDNNNPGTTPGQYSSQSQSFTYTPRNQLASASGYYGALSWTYVANGNRLTETANGVTSTYAYPTTSNRLTSVTPSGGTARSFTYDASGNILTDTRTGALGMTFQYDVEGRLSKAYQTNAPAQGATYDYDAFDRLASRTVTTTTSMTTTLYVHDLNNHIIAETDTAGVTRREYLWLDDIPVAVVDNVNTASPTLYYVHTDHLGRPARMVAQNWAWVWDVIYSPFGGTSYLWDNTAKLDARFPGQWFQLESGLAYNWHRHYDATLGRYVQPDPIGYDGGLNLYDYVGGNPLAYADPNGENPVLIAGAVLAATLLTPDSANAPGQGDCLQAADPLAPYFNGLTAGLLGVPGSGLPTGFWADNLGALPKWRQVLGKLYGSEYQRMTAREAILARGGNAANVREAGKQFENETVESIARMAAQRDEGAMKAMKIIKDASRLGQKY